ncbi:hypothetical protein BC829DRAFT_438445 [Chytridium lagenaria]|nr:hypothetical protein BC829DRAFT_438445 [Chytridium lagenaria]
MIQNFTITFRLPQLPHYRVSLGLCLFMILALGDCFKYSWRQILDEISNAYGNLKRMFPSFLDFAPKRLKFLARKSGFNSKVYAGRETTGWDFQAIVSGEGSVLAKDMWDPLFLSRFNTKIKRNSGAEFAKVADEDTIIKQLRDILIQNHGANINFQCKSELEERTRVLHNCSNKFDKRSNIRKNLIRDKDLRSTTRKVAENTASADAPGSISKKAGKTSEATTLAKRLLKLSQIERRHQRQ